MYVIGNRPLSELEPKLQKLMLAALEAIGTDEEWTKIVWLHLHLNTIGQRNLCKLRQATARLAPAASKVRTFAIDAGM